MTMPVWLEPTGPERKEQANLARTQQLDDPRPVGQTPRDIEECSRTCGLTWLLYRHASRGVH